MNLVAPTEPTPAVNLKRATAPKGREIKIEEGIPLPKYTKLPKKDDLVEDLKAMLPMQSRLIDLPFSEQELNRVRTRIHAILKKQKLRNRRFAVNKDPISAAQPGAIPKLRVWRVE